MITAFQPVSAETQKTHLNSGFAQGGFDVAF